MKFGAAAGERPEERCRYIYAGVTTILPVSRLRDYPVHWFWLFSQWLTGYGKFVHVYLGFDEHGRRWIYHSTKYRSHTLLREVFLLKRRIYTEWAIPVTDSIHKSFADSCHADNTLIPYGHLQNIGTGAIKLWNLFVKRLGLKFLVVRRNPFGFGAKRQNCSERAGRKLAEFVVGGYFLKMDPDLYAPDDFYSECLAYALADPLVIQTVSPPQEQVDEH